jgi:biotin carboxylase
MATPRRHSHVDVYVDTEGYAIALIRRHAPRELSWRCCRHQVRATSNAAAERKAIAAHRTHCQPR